MTQKCESKLDRQDSNAQPDCVKTLTKSNKENRMLKEQDTDVE